ncbi:hypothetical protein A9W99_23180 [Mycobacterium sp. 1164966.3]|uniref:hypothetical protein n=1 Tax=Mycobacterium sp. 1164966.3 TaxID=1856861 RepID=UPI0007FE6152|nr:hypothetical protein [Mycobacterium sp. 1164966.3]OBA78581.1 hypothetical protein A9W99_23180 [Mycobacterium sp. 1164966.3]
MGLTADGDGGQVGDRDLFEDAVTLLLTEAPPSWQQLHGEFEPSSQPVVAATGAFACNRPVWTLNTHFLHTGVMFTLRVLNGELRVCDIGAAPVP